MQRQVAGEDNHLSQPPSGCDRQMISPLQTQSMARPHSAKVYPRGCRCWIWNSQQAGLRRIQTPSTRASRESSCWLVGGCSYRRGHVSDDNRIYKSPLRRLASRQVKLQMLLSAINNRQRDEEGKKISHDNPRVEACRIITKGAGAEAQARLLGRRQLPLITDFNHVRIFALDCLYLDHLFQALQGRHHGFQHPV